MNATNIYDGFIRFEERSASLTSVPELDLEDEKNPRINVIVRSDNKVFKHILFLPSHLILHSSHDGQESLEIETINTTTRVHLQPHGKITPCHLMTLPSRLRLSSGRSRFVVGKKCRQVVLFASFDTLTTFSPFETPSRDFQALEQ